MRQRVLELVNERPGMCWKSIVGTYVDRHGGDSRSLTTIIHKQLQALEREGAIRRVKVGSVAVSEFDTFHPNEGQ